jgi:glyoxylase-like metal-dependent hydrolase (beta-lactamase superfamily II)
MILRQFLHTDPTVAVSYLFGCGGKQAGAVVDPIEPPEFYLTAAEDAGLRIQYVFDTHLHADHLSTGRTLAAAGGAAYVLHHEAGAALPFHGARDGDRIELGNVVAEVWHTPGHTPEHITLVVTDRTRSPEPWLVFTGHTLMVGDMGRTTLRKCREAPRPRGLCASAPGRFRRLRMWARLERYAHLDGGIREAIQSRVRHQGSCGVRRLHDARHAPTPSSGRGVSP